jgi:hypothetical protein
MAHGLPVPFTHTTFINHNDEFFPRLSMVKIFPMLADQAKKAALKETLIHQTLFQGKCMPSLRTKTL